MAPTIAKLGIMTARQEEFRLIAGAFGFTTSQDIGPRTFLSATHNDLELTLVAARVGKVAAAVTASLLIQEFGVDAIVVVGVAGATDSTVRIGDIVVADSLVQHDIDLKGAAVTQVCVEHGVPFVVTRIISDEASGHAAGDFGAFIEQAASVGSAAFVREFVSVLASGE